MVKGIIWKSALILGVLCFLNGTLYAQKIVSEKDVEHPEFVGGQAAYKKFLKDNLRYPKELKEKGVEGTVKARILINVLGEVSDPRILRSPHPEFSKEVVRLVSIMPDWIPALSKGKAINTYYDLSISFKLVKAEMREPAPPGKK